MTPITKDNLSHCLYLGYACSMREAYRSVDFGIRWVVDLPNHPHDGILQENYDKQKHVLKTLEFKLLTIAPIAVFKTKQEFIEFFYNQYKGYYKFYLDGIQKSVKNLILNQEDKNMLLDACLMLNTDPIVAPHIHPVGIKAYNKFAGQMKSYQIKAAINGN